MIYFYLKLINDYVILKILYHLLPPNNEKKPFYALLTGSVF